MCDVANVDTILQKNYVKGILLFCSIMHVIKRRIIKDQTFLHILQVEQERTQTDQSFQGMKQNQNSWNNNDWKKNKKKRMKKIT